MKSNILVIGGTGKTGRKVVSILKNKGHNVRIGSRAASPAFDWENPENWADALSGMEKVYITFQPDLAVPGALKAIKALTKVAKEVGVKKVVLLSGKGEKEAEVCEQVVMQSGLGYTIVRASWFMQNFSESFFLDPILAGKVELPLPEARVPYIDTGDIAAVAAEALIDDTHNGHIYELTGPKLLSFEEVINEIAKASARDIHFSNITVEDYVKQMKEHGVPDDYVWLINYLFTEVLASEENNQVTGDVEKVLKRKPKDFTEYALETASTGVWNPA